ncbi:MAG: helix-turn-helix transcriptional regulator [Muribaculaceae bacterium]|nr:helix-turn-helix transcriptional regulator [Muribaculaceae bacterium]
MQAKQILRNLKISQRDLAQRLNVSPSAVSQFLSNQNTSVKMLRRIAEAAGCSVGDFFADEMTATADNPLPDSSLKCPHCGKPIFVRLESDSEPTD